MISALIEHPDLFEAALLAHPDLLSLSLEDLAPYVPRCHAAGIRWQRKVYQFVISRFQPALSMFKKARMSVWNTATPSRDGESHFWCWKLVQRSASQESARIGLPRMALHDGPEHVQKGLALFARRLQITPDGREAFSSLRGPERSGNVLADFEHAQVPFDQVVGKGHRDIVEKPQRRVLVPVQPFQ